MKGSITNRELWARVRVKLSKIFALQVARGCGIEAIFNKSQGWDGFPEAFESWHQAFWKWVDRSVGPESLRAVRPFPIDWSRIVPHSTEDRLLVLAVQGDMLARAWLQEERAQQHLLRQAWFAFKMRHPEGDDAATFFAYCDDFEVAKQLGDPAYPKMVLEQRQRRPRKDKGDRVLYQSLLCYWIAGCLWAFTNAGIADFLQWRQPRSKPKRKSENVYEEGTIKDARAELKLHRKLHWWGLSGDPRSLVPL